MFCKNCGKESSNTERFCTECGTPASTRATDYVQDSPIPFSAPKVQNKTSKKNIVWILLVLAFISYSVYSSVDEDSINLNNEGVTSFDSGNTEQGIQSLIGAVDSAVTGATKINALKNLGYAYISDDQNDLALESFKNALASSRVGTFDYYLISGEIALLEGKPNAAQLSLTKAYEINPDDFQINNTLGLFYLDVDGVTTHYIDYPKALTHARKAYELSGSDAKNITTKNLGLAEYFNENYTQAVSLLSPYTSNDPYYSYLVGLSYLAVGDDINARVYLNKARAGGIELPQEFLDYLNS